MLQIDIVEYNFITSFQVYQLIKVLNDYVFHIFHYLRLFLFHFFFSLFSLSFCLKEGGGGCVMVSLCNIIVKSLCSG